MMRNVVVVRSGAELVCFSFTWGCVSLLQKDVLQRAFRAFRSGDGRAAAKLMAGCGFSTRRDLVTAVGSGGVSDAVSDLSLRLVDSRPTAGQGWVAPSNATAAATSIPQLVRYTLEDKRQKHEQLLEFLHRFHVWRFVDATCRLRLGTHGEQLACSNALAVHQGSGSGRDGKVDVVLAAMQVGVLKEWGVDKESLNRAGLTVQDVFYSKVSRVADVSSWGTVGPVSFLFLFCRLCFVGLWRMLSDC